MIFFLKIIVRQVKPSGAGGVGFEARPSFDAWSGSGYMASGGGPGGGGYGGAAVAGVF